ncbi:hypothetical protein, partial [Staphylococcus aureus]
SLFSMGNGNREIKTFTFKGHTEDFKPGGTIIANDSPVIPTWPFGFKGENGAKGGNVIVNQNGGKA